ncbi:hypothetical protein CBF34_06130 [Vagococcus penaei]|uniref:Uncharacterized protein n=1 Tax=Vagococcus penaei TaxID=633807 RepID=A0A1Q2D6R5_9ENTE|nr:DUF2812 domain-containing protein [Vagococcus penaei]AQP54116.1 hypothetical protein BW732_07710 [Vagococcus penaei]RSU02114.1 hypothetical protein CBF34_06130 [Vagococcus penaei]
MIIRNKKILYSKGIAYYPELEALRLKSELASGWQIEKLNCLGFYIFKKVLPQEQEFVIDFYSGAKKEASEYEELYAICGWQPVITYRHRYYIFSAPAGTSPVYTDEDTFTTRLSAENNWLLKNYTIYGLLSLLLTVLIQLSPVKSMLMTLPWFYYILSTVLMVGVLFPIIGMSLIAYYRVIYPNRKSSYCHPDRFAKRQRFIRDMLLTALIGGVIGGLAGFISSWFNLI